MKNFFPSFTSDLLVWTLAATALLPLISIPPWITPDSGKVALLRIFLSFAWIVFLWGVLSGKLPIVRLNWKSSQALLGFLLLALVVLFGIATLFSQDVHFSLWGDPLRSGGFVNLAFLVSLPLLLFLALKEPDWNFILKIFLWGAVGVSIFALAEAQLRPVSTVGSTMSLALFLLPTIFFFFPRLQKWSLVLILLFAIVVLLTQSRAAYIGFAVGLLFYILFLPEKAWWHNTKKRTLALVGLFLAIGSILFANFAPVPSTQLQRFQLSNIAIEPRFSAWQISIGALKERPLMGYGPENFSIGFDKYYDPSLPHMGRVRGSGVTTWWDRAHNIFLDIGVQAGVAAILVYLLLLGTLFWILWRLKHQNGKVALQAHGMQAAFLAYVVTNLFSFETLSSQLAFFFLVGYTLHLNAKQGNAVKLRSLPLTSPLVAVFALLLIWFNWQYTLQPLLQNKDLVTARAFLEQNQCKQAFPYLQSALQRTNAVSDSYAFLTYGEAIVQCKNEFPTQRTELMEEGRKALSQTVELRPTHTRAWIALGGLTNLLVEDAMQKEEAEKAAQLATEAHQFFERALQLSPKRQEVYIEWVKTFLIQRDYITARDKATECLSLNAKSPHCWFLLARAEISLGNTATGEQVLATAAELRYDTTSAQSLLQLANAYLATEQYGKMVQIYETLSFDSSYVRYYEVLIALYEKLGNKKEIETTRLRLAAQLALTERDYGAAATAANSCLALNSEKAGCWVVLARVEEARGNDQAAEQAYEQAQKLQEQKQ